MAITLNKHGLITGDAGGDEVQAAYGPLLDAQVDELNELLDQMAAAAGAIRSDRGLNHDGVLARLAKVGEDTWKQLQRLTANRRQKLDQDLGGAAHEMPEKLPKPSVERTPPMLLQLYLQEIREELRGLEPIERKITILAAAQAGDIDTLLAVQEAPAIIRDRIVPQSVMDEARAKYYEFNAPDEWRATETVRSAISLYEHNAQRAKQVIQSTCQCALSKP